MLNIEESNQFKKDLKLNIKRKINLQKLWDLIEKIQNEEILPPKNKNHRLIGNMNEFWECHIAPNWLLIYKIENGTLYLERTGTHPDLF